MSRLLVVEDDADVRDWIAHCLLGDGHERVSKPFDPEDLRAAARRALARGGSRG